MGGSVVRHKGEEIRLAHGEPDARIRRLRLKPGPARHHVETVVVVGYRFVR